LAHSGEVAARSPRIILVNDSPDDASVRTLLEGYARTHPKVLQLINEKNQGFVRSVNRGLALSLRDERDAILVNSDTITFKGTLASMLQVAAADPQIGFVCPRSNNASICSLPHFHGGKPPDAQESNWRWMQLSRTMPAWHFIPTAVGFYLYIAHRVLADHGLLRADFGPGYEEENDLVMRAGKVGVRAAMANHAFAYHAGSASFSLTGLDLGQHKHENLKKLLEFHPEFLPLVRRYESSAHFRAERLMTALLPDSQGRIGLAFDLTSMGQHHNGTNEQTVAVLKSLAQRHGDKLRLTGIADRASFEFHGLDKVPGLVRANPNAPGQHAIAVRMAQPYDLHQVNVLERIAPINVFAMLDTISEDCGPLLAQGAFPTLWQHVSRHASGLVFTSRHTEITFRNRYPDTARLPRWQKLLPTRIAEYAKLSGVVDPQHIFVLGNHFPHKGSEEAARRIAQALPEVRVVCLGAADSELGNLTIHRPGLLEPEFVESLFCQASVVVLPSHAEGFGFGFMHALAAKRPIVARDIPATREILETLDDVSGVVLFEDNNDLVEACRVALRHQESRADDRRGEGWNSWADNFADFCFSLIRRDDLFEQVVRRIEAGDLLRRAGLHTSPELMLESPEGPGTPTSPTLTLDALLKLPDESFVESAYATLLCRPADVSGRKTYLDLLAGGGTRARVLRALSESEEGRERGVELEGLAAYLLAADEAETAARSEAEARAVKPNGSVLRRLLRRA
jgi:GT2 family glycosyltransferase